MSAFVGIDLGGTQLRVAVADQRGALRVVLRRETGAATGFAHVFALMVVTVAEALVEAKLRPGDIPALGLSMPGPLDPRTGVVGLLANLPGWKGVPINRLLTRATGIRSYVHHDAHLAVFGEARKGIARGARDAIYVTVSTGIGAGLLLDGALYSGWHGMAGEVGHIVIERDGPPCPCGNRGCLEVLASGTAIARMAREALVAGRRTSLRNRADKPLSAREVAAAARAGDPVARHIYEQAGSALGVGLGTLVNLFNPELLILGGSVMKAGPLITVPMRARLRASSWPTMRAGLRIVRPALGADAGLLGAVEWARFRAGA